MHRYEQMGARLIELPCVGCGAAVVLGSIGGDENDQGIAEAWVDDLVRPYCPSCWPYANSVESDG